MAEKEDDITEKSRVDDGKRITYQQEEKYSAVFTPVNSSSRIDDLEMYLSSLHVRERMSRSRRKSSPHLRISNPEPIAELFPSDSDQGSLNMSNCSLYSSKGSAASTHSAPLRGKNAYSESEYELRGLLRSDSVRSFPDFHAEPEVRDSQSVFPELQVKLDDVRKGHIKRAVKVNRQLSTSSERISVLERKIDNLTQRFDRFLAVKEWMDRPVEEHEVKRKEVCTSTWLIDYKQMRQTGVKSVRSSPLPLPNDCTLNAVLFTEGRGGGADSHLSLLFTLTSNLPLNFISSLMNEGRISASVIDAVDSSETIVKAIPLDIFNDMEIPKLIPISTVQDPSLNYLRDGRLTIGISVMW